MFLRSTAHQWFESRTAITAYDRVRHFAPQYFAPMTTIFRESPGQNCSITASLVSLIFLDRRLQLIDVVDHRERPGNRPTWLV